MIQIQNGKLYKNRTLKYLYPCLKAYHTELITKLNSLIKLGIGIGDSNSTGTEGKACIFILINTTTPLSNSQAYQEKLDKFLEWVANQHYYVQDYMYSNIVDTQAHMLVLRLPETHEKTYLNFIMGEYSLMYDKKDIKKYFSPSKALSAKVNLEQNSEIENTKKVLLKDSNYVSDFAKIVNKRFKTNVDSYHFKEAELDFRPNLDEEIFNI